MPIYEYRCERGHTLEVLQSIGGDPLTSCTDCGASVKRVFHPVAIHFKGSGFYTTDYARKGGGYSGESATSDGSESKDAGADGAAKSSGGKDSGGSGEGAGGKPAAKSDEARSGSGSAKDSSKSSKSSS